MEALTPASADDLPPLGELVADDPFWRYPAAGLCAREGVVHLRIWLTAGPEPGHLAVVTETGLAASVTESAGHIWTEVARRYGPPLVLLEHYRAPEAGEGVETLDLSASAPMAARIGPASGRPRRTTPGTPGWSCGWPRMDTRLSAGPRASSTDARTTDRQRVTGAGTGWRARRQAQLHCPASRAIWTGFRTAPLGGETSGLSAQHCRVGIPHQAARLSGDASALRRRRGRRRLPRGGKCPARSSSLEGCGTRPTTKACGSPGIRKGWPGGSGGSFHSPVPSRQKKVRW